MPLRLIQSTLLFRDDVSHSRSHIVKALVIATCIVMPLFVAGRLYGRAYTKGSTSLGFDDLIIFLCACVALVFNAVSAVQCKYGLGSRLYDLDFEWIDTLYQVCKNSICPRTTS